MHHGSRPLIGLEGTPGRICYGEGMSRFTVAIVVVWALGAGWHVITGAPVPRTVAVYLAGSLAGIVYLVMMPKEGEFAGRPLRQKLRMASPGIACLVLLLAHYVVGISGHSVPTTWFSSAFVVLLLLLASWAGRTPLKPAAIRTQPIYRQLSKPGELRGPDAPQAGDLRPAVPETRFPKT